MVDCQVYDFPLCMKRGKKAAQKRALRITPGELEDLFKVYKLDPDTKPIGVWIVRLENGEPVESWPERMIS